MSDPWPPLPPGPDDANSALPGDPAARRPSDADRAQSASPPASGPARARASANRRALTITIAVVLALLVLGTLAASRVAAPGTPTYPPVGATTGPAGAAAATTRGLLAGALGAAGIQVEDVKSPYRPAEAARLAAAPRLVVRAVIPNDPDHGRLVIYEFVTTAEASSAAEEQAAYVASGIGQIQFPPDTQFTVRVIGSTVVFYALSQANSPDFERATAVSTALQTLGFGVAVPR